MFYIRFKKILLKNVPIAHFRSFPLFWWVMWAIRSQSLISSEHCERIAQVAQQKWAMWANRSGRSPKMSDHEQFAHIAQRKWASWANRSGRSPKMIDWVNCSFFWANRSFTLFWAKNQQFARKTDERIPSPDFYTFLGHKWWKSGQENLLNFFFSMLYEKDIKNLFEPNLLHMTSQH